MKEINEETPEAFKQITLPIRTLTSVFFFKRSFRNTIYDVFAHVTRANKIYSMYITYPIRVTTHMTLCANVNCKEPCTYCITPTCQLFVLEKISIKLTYILGYIPKDFCPSMHSIEK